MKTLMQLLLLSFLTILMGCGDDDSSPSVRDQLIGTWVLEEQNGIKVSPSFIFKVTMEADGDYEEDINDNGDVSRYTGEWELNDAQDEITIDYDQFTVDWELDIESLTADELEVDDASNTYLLVRD